MSDVQVKRERKRIESLPVEKSEIAERIKRFYDRDTQDRKWDIDARLQRYAKYRMWTEGKNWPWEGATDAALPDMMTASMRLQDTLHNAVMSQRPPIMAKATRGKKDEEKEEKINHLLDFQFFEEQPGEFLIGQIAEDFVNDGFFTCYTPWIDEKRRVMEVKVYEPIPADQMPYDYFQPIVEGFFPQADIKTGDGWDWKVEKDGKRFKASFFTKPDGRVELDLERETQVFLGPRALRKDLQDVIHPARCENLQIPGPSNPTGAAHVILQDFPTIDEIKRLREEGYYDLMDDADAEKLGLAKMTRTENQERQEQRDTMQGHVEQKDNPKGAESQNKLTRLMCFDCFDIDGDGLDEDVVFWMILETKTLLKAVYLSQNFPSDPPRRPFGEAQLFGVPGSRYGIGMLEMMEGVHDLIKQFMDQGGDAGILANSPFGFYRATSNMKPEVIRMWPGEMYPLADPKNDVNFPPMGNQNQSFMFNFIALLTQVEEKLTTIGDLQVGRVPQGKSSALRTVAGMQTVLAQGDARPERVLRRFFMGLSQVFQNFHELNEVMLPPNKAFKICGPSATPGKEIYGTIGSSSEIRGKFLFTFSANALNTSKEATQAALQSLMASYISPLAIQLGLTKPDGAYRLMRDYGRSLGQDPDKYINPPTPGAIEPPISMEDAVAMIMDGAMPAGKPLEGTEEHLGKLQEFAQSDEFGYLGEAHIPLFRAYLQKVAQMAAEERSQQALLASAQQFSQGNQQPGLPGPEGQPQPDAQVIPPTSGELVDKALPGAGGGANTVAA